MPPAPAHTKAASVEDVFKHHFGYKPPHQVKAPGRLELLGNHTDYNDGLVMSVAVDRYIHMAIAPRTDGKIELINQAANKIMGIYKLSHVSAIKIQQPDIYQLMTALPSGESKLLKVSNQEISLSVKEIILRDRKIRLIALHNIRSELQTRELEAWQNLTKVLRHEIMNTVTPIVSLSQTMRDIIDTDLKDISGHQQEEGVKDLKNAITTVINRSKGIMNFVNAYREFTNIPLPNIAELQVSQVFDELKSFFENQPTHFIIEYDFKILADKDQIGQVLINLLKNAIEATEKTENATISIRAYMNQQDKIIAVMCCEFC